MERLAPWDKSQEELATVLRLDDGCKEQQLHINGSNAKHLWNKEAVTERYQILNLDFCLLSYLLSYVLNLLTPWNRVLFENLTGSQVVKEFTAFYLTQMFITAFTSVRHLTHDRSTPSHFLIIRLNTGLSYISYKKICCLNFGTRNNNSVSYVSKVAHSSNFYTNCQMAFHPCRAP